MPWPPGSRPSPSTCSPTTRTARRCWPTTGSATASTRCARWGARWPVRWTLPPGPTTVARNLPVLDDWDGIGRPTAAIAHHPSHREAGRQIYGTGIMTAYAESGVDGRTGGLCPATPRHRGAAPLHPVAVPPDRPGRRGGPQLSAGLRRRRDPHAAARGHRRAAGAFLPAAARPGLRHQLHRLAVPHRGAGRIRRRGQRHRGHPVAAIHGGGGPGSAWTIRGEKWFCSNADADVFLMTARVAEPATGTRGLGLFLVPRLRADGSINGFRIRRLKDKLGTRSMASAEIDFVDAEATALGPGADGFRNVIELVITTSRLFNAAGCAAHARRAWVVASHLRAAPHGVRPADRAVPAGRRDAGLDPRRRRRLPGWHVAAGRAAGAGWTTPAISDTDAAFFRVAVNLNKLQTSVLAHDAVNRGIEVLGGNGAIETFSVLPRLLRDNVVYENWEGSHNVLRAQVLRDCARLGRAPRLLRRAGRPAAQRMPRRSRADREALEKLLTESDEVRDLRLPPPRPAHGDLGDAGRHGAGRRARPRRLPDASPPAASCPSTTPTSPPSAHSSAELPRAKVAWSGHIWPIRVALWPISVRPSVPGLATGALPGCGRSPREGDRRCHPR